VHSSDTPRPLLPHLASSGNYNQTTIQRSCPTESILGEVHISDAWNRLTPPYFVSGYVVHRRGSGGVVGYFGLSGWGLVPAPSSATRTAQQPTTHQLSLICINRLLRDKYASIIAWMASYRDRLDCRCKLWRDECEDLTPDGRARNWQSVESKLTRNEKGRARCPAFTKGKGRDLSPRSERSPALNL